MKLPSVYNDLCFKRVFEIANRRPHLTLPLGCEQRKLRSAASAGRFSSSRF
jgi:hypothetical protein